MREHALEIDFHQECIGSFEVASKKGWWWCGFEGVWGEGGGERRQGRVLIKEIHVKMRVFM